MPGSVPAPTTDQGTAGADAEASPRRRHTTVILLAVLLIVAVAGMAVATTTAVREQTHAESLSAGLDQTTTERDTALDRAESAESRIASAESRADEAEQAGDARQAELDERESGLEEREHDVADREKAVSKTEQKIEDSRIDEGVWTVGTDVAPGTYRTTEPVSGDCYWAIYRSDTNQDDIVQNDIVTGGRPTVTLRDGQDFETNRCGTWDKQ